MLLEERCIDKLDFSCKEKDFQACLFQIKNHSFAEYHIFIKGQILLRAIITIILKNNDLEFHIPYCSLIFEDELLNSFKDALL